MCVESTRYFAKTYRWFLITISKKSFMALCYRNLFIILNWSFCRSKVVVIRSPHKVADITNYRTLHIKSRAENGRSWSKVKGSTGWRWTVELDGKNDSTEFSRWTFTVHFRDRSFSPYSNKSTKLPFSCVLVGIAFFDLISNAVSIPNISSSKSKYRQCISVETYKYF